MQHSNNSGHRMDVETSRLELNVKKKSKSEEEQKKLSRIRRMKQAEMLIRKEWSGDPIAAL